MNDKDVTVAHAGNCCALKEAMRLAKEFLNNLGTGPVGTPKTYEELLSLWEQKLPVEGMNAIDVISELSSSATPGLMLNQSGRFFAWVIGGSHPSAMAADWLTSAWDQNPALYACAPSAGIAEEISGKWLKQLLNLPEGASFALVTGCQMAHFTCLNAARNHIFSTLGWDIETQGFYGAPRVRILCSDQKHGTVSRAIRMLGFGTNAIINVPTDEKGRVIVEKLRNELQRDSSIPAIVILQAGDINTGAYDDFKSIVPLAHEYNAWVHIDGAFGLWAAANPDKKYLMEGASHADSWATDGHKWLNVPYDSGYAFVAHPDAHYHSLSHQASYITHALSARDEMDWNPEWSRRARGFATYAVIRELGVEGIAALIERTCRHASTIVNEAGKFPGVEIISLPVINQGLLRFLDPVSKSEKDHDTFTEKVIESINNSGEAFFQPTTFKGKRCMRVSVSSWRTNETDVNRTIEAIWNAMQSSQNPLIL